MANLSTHQGSSLVRVLYIGDPTAGKTGSLTSLVKAGYNLRILDYDNKLSVLKQFIVAECPDKLVNVDVETLRDKYKATKAGPVVSGVPTAYVRGTELLTKWSDDSIPAEWGPRTVFVLDSLTALGRAAFEWAKGMAPLARDPRQWFFQAQQSIENLIGLLTSESFNCHVIVISHINWKELQDGTTKGYASSIGSALGPVLGRYFNTIIQAETTGFGKNVKRRIRTIPTGTVDLITPAPFKIDAELPLETGLATLFQQLENV